MLFGNPVRGTIRPDKRFYRGHPLAEFRAGRKVPLVTQDFGPSTVEQEPAVDWPGGEFDILGRPIAAKRHEHFHRAIDISRGACSGDVVAAAPGEVIVSRRNKAKTEIIVIDHGVIDGHRYRTRYAHLEPRLVQVGTHVEAGAVIGTLGGSGLLSTGCHLHFAVKKDGRAVDPWRRLAQNTSIDPDLPVAPPPVPATPLEVLDVPIPASDLEYLAGQVALVGNTSVGAQVRIAPRTGAALVRTIPGGLTETWLPTCWVVGDLAFNSDRWLARWHLGRWEFTHAVNVASVTEL